jgi:glycolate oxidase FAD binding subunit
VLSTRELRGLVAWEPGDQTVTVRAGTPLAELQAALAGQRQVLPASDADGSVGGLLATAQDGPLDLFHGRLRERLLGVTVALADGSLASGRGRVVKNVAGYDLPRLLWGSLGTLGVIVEATFRVAPCPAARARLTAHCADAATAFAAARLVLDSPCEPAAVDVLAPPGATARLTVVLEGPPTGLAARAAALRDSLASLRPADVALQTEDPTAVPADPLRPGQRAALVRVACEAAAQPALARALATGPGAAVLARPGLELLFAAFDAPPPPGALDRTLALCRAAGPAVLWRAPPGTRLSVETVWGPPPSDLPLMRRVKAALDPHGTLVAGRFVGGL